jgi:hypothetical protein
MTRPRKRLALVALLAVPLLSIAMLGFPAAAATRAAPAKTVPAVMQAPQVRTASGCNRRICLQVHILGKWAFAKAWPRFGPDRFDGHYQLFNPRRNFYNSGPNQIWTHNDPWVPNRKPALAGKWCVIGWRYNGGHNYTNIGQPCVTVTLR